jgi:Zn-finger nucleic acid-binding protein
MNCPIDGTTLLMSERQGIEIDYCPQCRGIWLDRGELEKLIERASQMEGESRSSRGIVYDTDYDDDDDFHKRKNTPHDNRSYPERRKRGFLDDLFDIFD